MSLDARRWALTLTISAVLCGFAAMLFPGVLADPQLRGVDYIAFYTAGRLAREAPLSELYDLDRQRAVQHPIVGPEFVEGGVLSYNHPPFLAPLLGLLTDGDYRASYVRWVALMAVAAAAAALALAALYRQQGGSRAEAAMVALGGALFYPALISLLKGQDTALILLGAAGWAAALLAGRPATAGVSLGLTVIKPQLALSLGLPVLLTSRRAGLGFLLSAGGLGLASMAMVGPAGVRDYLALIALSNAGAGYGLNQEAMYNLVGLLVRAAPGMDGALLNGLKWAAFLAGTGAVCALWWARRRAVGPAEVGAATVVALLVSPHLHFHDLSLLLVAAVALALRWRGAGGRRADLAPALPALTSAALLLVDLLPGGAGYAAGYALMAALLVGLLARRPPLDEPAAPAPQRAG